MSSKKRETERFCQMCINIIADFVHNTSFALFFQSRILIDAIRIIAIVKQNGFLYTEADVLPCPR